MFVYLTGVRQLFLVFFSQIEWEFDFNVGVPHLPSIEELIKYGQITLSNVRPVGCLAVAHDGRQM